MISTRNLARSSLMIALLVFYLFPAYASAHARKRVRTAQGNVQHRRSSVRQLRTVQNRKRIVRRSSAAHTFRSHTRVVRGSRARRRVRMVRGWRMPGMHIAPERTEQIQQALIQAGDLHELPTGRWDPQTRDAMKLYQQSNGFSTTGLPDAKSLMKMGLGPHPLPSDVAPVAQAQPGFTPPPDGSRPGIPNPSPDD